MLAAFGVFKLQRLSHVLALSFTGQNCEWFAQTVTVYLIASDLVIPDKSCGFAEDALFKFLTYQFPMVGFWPTVPMTGNGKLGFDGAREMVTESKEGNRRANFPPILGFSKGSTPEPSEGIRAKGKKDNYSAQTGIPYINHCPMKLIETVGNLVPQVARTRSFWPRFNFPS